MAEESKSKKLRLENETDTCANFPNEIWLKIFEYFSTYEVLRKIALVNRNFNNISKDSSLLKKIHLKIDKLDNNSAKDAYETIQRSRNLIELIISSDTKNRKWDWKRFSPGFFISIALKSSPKLRILIIDLENGILSRNFSRNILFNLGLDKNGNFEEAKKKIQG